jgi:transcriptional regulator
MYRPPAFREDRRDVLHEAIRAHPLATLVTSGSSGLVANLIPFTLAGDIIGGDVLRAHLARANSQLEDLREGTEALVIFQGPQAYITPSWYATKQEHGRVVPTWNYVVVQAWGKPKMLDDSAWLLDQVNELTDQQEQSRETPWSVVDAPESFIASQLKGIVGIEIPVDRIEGKWKASQNQPAANRATVVSGLKAEASLTPMATIVAQRSPPRS